MPRWSRSGFMLATTSFILIADRRLLPPSMRCNGLPFEGLGEPDLKLEAPFVHLGKHQIVKLGTSLGVPYGDTWSCYKGGERHCGTCGTCGERKHAFRDARV